jgi:hypothetical protein
MEPARSRPGRFATTSAHRALVIVALFFNTLLLALGLAYGDLETAVGVTVYAAPPVGLLMLERFPLAFRLLAAVLGVVYFSFVAFFAGGVLWVPAALTLLTAALLPGLASGAAARRRRRMIYLGAMAGLVLVIAVTLVLLAL